MTDDLRQLSILMFAPLCFPPTQPEAIVNAKLALALKEAGCYIDVITHAGMTRHWYPHKEAVWGGLEEFVHPVAELPRNLLNRARAKLRTLRLTGRILSGGRWGVPAFETAAALVSRTKYDLVLSRATPDAAHLPALLFHRATGTPWIANWNDPRPLYKLPPPYGDGPSSPMTPASRRLYRAITSHCAWHTFPCERLRRYMCSYMPGNIEAKSSVVAHIAMARFSAPPVPHDGFSICYAGSLTPPRDARVLLEGAKRFAHKMGNPKGFRVRFLVDQPRVAADAAGAVGAGDLLSIEPARPYEEIPEALARSDVLVIIEAPLKEGIFFPSKFVDYVQAGRPILALSPTVGTLADILSTHGGGLAVDGTSPDAVAEAIETFYRHWKAGSLDEAYGSSKLLGLFDECQVLGQYAELFRHVLARHGAAT